MSHDAPEDSRALARLTELLRDAPAPPSQVQLERGLSALHTRLAGRRRSPRKLSWTVAFSLVGALLLVAALVWRGRGAPPERPVAVSRIEGGQLLQGGYLSESGASGIRLSFDEGSQCALSPGGRGRLRIDAKTGVRLLLDRGSASLRITKTREPRWSVESGPFVVTVKGTDFTVDWDPTSERFELTLRHGRVVVSGPLLGEDFVVRPGQKLSVSLPKAETVITEERAAAPASVGTTPAAPAASPLAAEPGAAATADLPAAPKPSSSVTSLPTRQWPAALANGEFDRILAEAERAGTEATLETAPSEDLFALADAARYRRRVELAQSALLAQRRRFPASPRSTEAIFLLGRVAELRASGRATALSRYDEYLARAPRGTYAAEALGRKMTLSNELEGPAAARPIAEAYLRRFPGGSYAGAARTLLRVAE